MADFIQQVASTAITDQNIHQLVKQYLGNPSQLPPDLQNKRIGEWDVSRVTNMSELFFNHRLFDEPLDKWNVSNVTNMSKMFHLCFRFNQPLTWDVGNVTNMSKMFEGCSRFDQPLTWDVGNVTDMSYMFERCSSFDQPLTWDVGNVTNMSHMFVRCSRFDQPLTWNVRNVTNMSYMFYECDEFDEPIGSWNVSNVTDMTSMFQGCFSFDQPLTWDVGNVTDMSYMFEGCFRFDQPLTWNVRNVTNMSYMFKSASKFRGEGLKAWNVSNVTKMSYMFTQCVEFDEPIGSWNVSNVTNMSYMFYGCVKFDEPIGSWDVGNVTDMTRMFYKCVVFDEPIGSWNVRNVTNMTSMFDGCESFNQDISSWEQRLRPYLIKDYIFYNCPIRDDYKPLRSQFQGINDYNIEYLVSQYFDNASMLTTKLRDIPLGKWDVSRVTNMSGLFSTDDGEENDFSGEGLEAWDVSNVTNMSYMFYNCVDFDAPIGSWNVRNVTDMAGMFEGCESFNQDISSWEQRLRPDVRADSIFEECPLRDDYKPLRFRRDNNRRVRARVDPFQVHKGAKKINYKKLCDFLQEHTGEVPVQALDTFGKFIETAMTNFIRDSGVDGQASLENIMVSRLRNLQYDQFGTDLLRTCKYALYYVERQSSGFKRAYVETFLLDCTQAYEGEGGGMTCAQGALERIIISLVTAVQTMVSLGNQKPEWETLIAIIEADPAKMIPSYIQDWYKAHNSKGTGAFAAVTSGDMRRADLRTYLLQRFPNETALIDQQIQKVADHIGYDDDVFQYGGRPTIRKRAIARATRRRTSQKRKKTRRRARK
jgi:surface protein